MGHTQKTNPVKVSKDYNTNPMTICIITCVITAVSIYQLKEVN